MIEKYVVSLDLAKELKEAGYPQAGGGFYWVKYRLEDIDTSPEDEHFADPLVNPDAPVFKKYSLLYLSAWDYKYRFPANIVDFVKAPLAEEILEKLPISIFIKVEFPAIAIENYAEGRYYYLQIEPYESCYKVGYYWEDKLYAESDWLVSLKDEKLSDALARLWLWLKENGYLEERDED